MIDAAVFLELLEAASGVAADVAEVVAVEDELQAPIGLVVQARPEEEEVPLPECEAAIVAVPRVELGLQPRGQEVETQLEALRQGAAPGAALRARS